MKYRTYKGMLLAMILMAGTAEAVDEYQRVYLRWAEEAAVRIVTRGDAEVQVEHWLKELYDEALQSIGVANDQIGGALLRYALAMDTKGEIVSKVMDGDKVGALEKSAACLAGAIAEARGVKNVGDIMGVGFDGLHAEGDAIDRLQVVAKSTLKAIFPQLAAVENFANLVEKSANIWTDYELNDAYLRIYKPKARSSDGEIPDEDWSAIVVANLRGAGIRSCVKGMDEKAVRELFRKRFVNEGKIAATQKKLDRLAARWHKLDLTNFWEFPKGMSLSTRLTMLYDNREKLRRMLTRGGKLMKGDFAALKDEEFLDWVEQRWYSCGDDGKLDVNHAAFYAWLKEIGIPPSPETVKKNYQRSTKAKKPTHRWELVATDVDKAPNVGEGDSRFDYEATVERHSRTYRSKTRSVWAVATCSKPPANIDADKEFSLEVKLELDGIVDGSFKDAVQVGLEGPDARRVDDPSKAALFTNEDGIGRFEVDQEGIVNQSASVSGVLPRGMADNERRCLCFRSGGCLTRWTYEWKPLEERTKKPDAAKVKASIPPPTITGGVARVEDNWSCGFLKCQGVVSGGLIASKPVVAEGRSRVYSGIVRPGETIVAEGRLLAASGRTAWDEWSTVRVWIKGDDPLRHTDGRKRGGEVLPSLSGSYVVSENDFEVHVNIYYSTEWWHPWTMGGSDSSSLEVKYKVVK